METEANVGPVLVDLWASILKVLGRPAIQQQLLLGLLAVFVAWALAHWIIRRMHRQEATRIEALRGQVLAEVQLRLAEIDQRTEAESRRAAESEAVNTVQEEPNELEDRTELALLLQDEEALNAVVAERRGPQSRLHALLQQVLFPVLAILFLYGGYVYAVAVGWYSGLIVNLIVLFGFYFLYRLAFGIAHAVGNPEQSRLLPAPSLWSGGRRHHHAPHS